MLELSDVAVDPKLANSGVWANYMGGQFLVARHGHAYNQRLGDLYNENRDLLNKRDPESNLLTVEAAAKMREIHIQAFAETVLLDWKDISEKGKKLKYTVATAMKILTDPRYQELTDYLESFSRNHYHYRDVSNQEVAKGVKTTAVS